MLQRQPYLQAPGKNKMQDFCVFVTQVLITVFSYLP